MTNTPLTSPERRTGALFGKLFPAYSAPEYVHSVELFRRRWTSNGRDPRFFEGKECLDAGCGGGRFSIAMAALGARSVVGIDASSEAIEDANVRAETVPHVSFRVGSVERLPFEDASFDFVCFSGVLQHTPKPEEAMAELSRVLRPGGSIYMLVYATGGVRWPMTQLLRPLVADVGFDVVDAAVAEAGLSAAKRRTLLDDLFVPIIDFYSWDRLASLLERHGFEDLDRWSKGRLDHEEDLAAYAADLTAMRSIFEAGERSSAPMLTAWKREFATARQICDGAVAAVTAAENDAKTPDERNAAMTRLIGQGHHRLVARRK